MADVDYYDILDVRPTASAEEIKAAYYRAVRSAHPDAGGTAGMFRLVSDAYRTLADPRARAAYDARIATAGAGASTDSPGSQTQAPAEPEWGEEESWTAEPAPPREGSPPGEYPLTSVDQFVDRQFARLRRWIVTDAARGVLLSWLTATVAIYAAFTYVLAAQREWVRPSAAGSDLWGNLLDNDSLLRWALIVYGILVLGGIVGILWIPLAAVHLATLGGFVAWGVAYWGLATGAERWAFLGVLGLWSVYALSMAVLPMLGLHRIQELRAKS